MKLLSPTKLFFYLGLCASTPSFAEQSIQVWARAAHHSCGYYSSTDADFDVTILDTHIPYGATVTLVSGLGTDHADATDRDAHWKDTSEQKMEAINASTWRVRRSTQLNARGNRFSMSKLEFAVRVDLPGNESKWITPGGSGTYFSAPINLSAIRCVNPGAALPPFEQIKVLK